MKISRRKFLREGATASAAVAIASLASALVMNRRATTSATPEAPEDENKVRVTSPTEGKTLESFLTAKLEWDYAARKTILIHGIPYSYFNYPSINLKLSPNENISGSWVEVDLPDNVTSWCLPVLPNHKYYWQITPRDEQGDRPDLRSRGSFTTGKPRIDDTTDSNIRYKNARVGAHFRQMKPVSFGEYEPLSPWYKVKSYNSPPPPRFEDIKDRFPVPVFDGHPEALEVYWYCWKTLLDVWYCAPDAPDHQAVANLNCIRSWGPWGSSQVWDSATMMFFAKYGHQAYPFINQYDNAYARQHCNGFICRESDKNNREVYSSSPVAAPFLLAWSEWKYYQLSGDAGRSKQVLMPIVKNYEWWMTYMRRGDGVYWLEGLTKKERLAYKGDDTMDYAVGANSTRAAEALYLAKIAEVTGRPDLAEFFKTQQRSIGQIVNDRFWDTKHQIYNDRCDPDHPILKYRDPRDAGKFITELKPGVFNKPFWIFSPLFAEIVPQERLRGLIQELENPNSFNRLTGVPTVSADSATYNRATATVWAPYQCIVQEGLMAYGQARLAQELAEKYFNAVVATYKVEKTIKESILADKLQFSGAPDFVGWGGLGPVANLIEYILGFDISVPEKKITWRISRTERHGIQNLRFGDFYIELVCEASQAADKPRRVTVRSEGVFDLRIILNGKTTQMKIEKGTVTLQAG